VKIGRQRGRMGFMRSRKDQVQAHAYVVSRLTSALVRAEPDAPESPLRRTGLGTFGGLLIGALAVAGFLIWGLISPASSSGGLTAGELIMVNETGARYIYLPGELRPVLNWSSALMLTGGDAAVTSVRAGALDGIPAGQALGIVGAPDSLPAASAVNTGAWLVCDQDGDGGQLVSVSIGTPPALHRPSAAQAAIVTAAGTRYLLWNGHRLRIDAAWIVNALGLNLAHPIPVSQLWLNSVPAGPDLRPLVVPGSGAGGQAVGGQPRRVGQVLLEHNVASADQYYLVEARGVAPVTATQAAVILTDPADAAAYAGHAALPILVSPGAIAHVPQVGAGLADSSGGPAAPPADFAPAGGNVPCMDYAAAGGTSPALVFAVPPAGQPPALGAPAVTASTTGAGLISVTPDGGALVRPESAPGVAAGSFFLVTDAGVKFPLPSANVAALGYSTRRAAWLPSALLGLLPTGPALDLAPLRG
jgi:type VII secretion protein EccB